MKCTEMYKEIYGKDALDVSFCPYRICPIGAHSDHNLGKITGFAIDKGINIAYGINEKEIIVNSLDFNNEHRWNINVNSKENDWTDYLRGATFHLNQKHHLSIGINCVIEGSIPVGGLSSSAAVIISFLYALCKANNIKLTEREMIDTAFDAENKFVGVNVGKLDQSCEVLCKKDHLLYLDTKDNSYELIKKPDNMKNFDILILYSGLEHSLVSSGFNNRVDELKQAANMLASFAGIKKENILCRDIDRNILDTYKNKLPENLRLRAMHWFEEYNRVEKAAEAFRNGDIEKYGRLSFESGYSSIHNWQTGSPEQIKLYELIKETQGVYGGRFSGAGFKGSCIALVDPNYTDRIIYDISRKYLKEFPNMENKYKTYICTTSDGVKL